MDFRKFISVWALLALMVGQVLLAQHSATHIDHGFSQEVVVASDEVNDSHHHDEDSKKHECPECLLTKSLQTAFYHGPVTLSFAPQVKALILQPESSIFYLNHYNSNSPRAPPVTLI